MGFDYGDKIRALLAMADDMALTEVARTAYRAKAEEFMVRYRVELADALAAGTADEPIRSDATVGPVTSHLMNYYRSIVREIADHCGVKVHFFRDGDLIKVAMIGFEGDVRYADFLWAGAYLMMATRIDPRWDVALTENENIWRMRNAGITRKQIATAAWGVDAGRLAKNRSKVQRIYLAESDRRGEVARAVGLGHNAEDYQDAYAREFWFTLSERLRMARDAVDVVGGGLILHGRDQAVLAAFWAAFPQYRPADDAGPRAEWVDPRKACDRCQRAASGHCRNHSYLKPRAMTAAERARSDRRYNGPSARAGGAAGTHAAEGVIIQRGQAHARRLDESGRAIEN